MITVRSEAGLIEARYFILRGCGGLELRESDALIRIVTPASPAGREVIGKEVGDEVAVRPGRDRSGVIIAID
jgi:hypothetical protein